MRRERALSTALIGAEFSRNRADGSSPRHTSPLVASFRTRISCDEGGLDVIEAWFRAQDSNLRFWGQSPASCLLDDPGSMVGPEGFEPSRSRVRAECASSCTTDPLVGREGLEPSSLGLKARCPPIERTSLSDAWRCFVSIVVFLPERTEGRPERPRGGLRGSVENAQECLRIAILPEMLSRFDLRAHVS